MKKEYMKYLLIPLFLIIFLSINSEPAEAAESAVVVTWNNVTNTVYPGTMNLTVNISNILGAAGAGICNVSFYATGQDSTQLLLSTVANDTANANQTMFDFEWDTTAWPDQIYQLDAIAANCSDTLADGGDATALTAVVTDNANLVMTWETTTSNYNNTIGGFCPKDSTLYFGISGSDDEMINANPTLYFKSKGTTATYTNSYTVTRGAASLNYTTTVNNTFTSLFSLPQDTYYVWVTYTDTDGTNYDTAQLDIDIKCDGSNIGPFIAEEKEKDTDVESTRGGFIIIIGIVVGLWILHKFSSGG